MEMPMETPAQTGRNRRGATTTQNAERSAGSTAIRVMVKADEIMPQAIAYQPALGDEVHACSGFEQQ